MRRAKKRRGWGSATSRTGPLNQVVVHRPYTSKRTPRSSPDLLSFKKVPTTSDSGWESVETPVRTPTFTEPPAYRPCGPTHSPLVFLSQKSSEKSKPKTTRVPSPTPLCTADTNPRGPFPGPTRGLSRPSSRPCVSSILRVYLSVGVGDPRSIPPTEPHPDRLTCLSVCPRTTSSPHPGPPGHDRERTTSTLFVGFSGLGVSSPLRPPTTRRQRPPYSSYPSQYSTLPRTPFGHHTPIPDFRDSLVCPSRHDSRAPPPEESGIPPTGPTLHTPQVLSLLFLLSALRPHDRLRRVATTAKTPLGLSLGS